MISKFIHFYHFRWEEVLALPFGVFLDLYNQIDNVRADEVLNGWVLSQSEAGIKYLKAMVEKVYKRIPKELSSKEKIEDLNKCNETFLKIRKLKEKLGGKLRPIAEEEEEKREVNDA